MSAKRRLQLRIGALAESRAFRPLLRSFARSRVNIVYYHHVGECNPYYSEFYCGCTLERFRSDLAFLHKVFQIVPLATVLAFNEGGDAPEVPYLAVTFDDGFDLCRKEVRQILDEFHVKATTFVITSCLDNRNLMWRNKLSVIRATVSETFYVPRYNDLMKKLGRPEINAGNQLMAASTHWDMARKDEWADALWKACRLPSQSEFLEEQQPYFTWEGLRDWIGNGHSVGFHTHTHPFCSCLRREEMEQEIFQPAKQLKERLGLVSLPFSYPFGDRFRPECEQELLAHGVFNASFGIKGFSKRNTPGVRLEREAVEGLGAGWSVFGRSILRPLRREEVCP